MAALETGLIAAHLLFAGLWVGAVTFLALGVLPATRKGAVDATSLGIMTGRLATLSRLSAVVLLATGGDLARRTHTTASLLWTLEGRLVLAMAVLWLLLILLVEVGRGRLAADMRAAGPVEPGRGTRGLFVAATIVGVVLLALGGVLSV